MKAYTYLFIPLFLQCYTTNIQLGNTAQDTREILFKHIPLGSTISFSRKIMDENNFDCSLVFNGQFMEYEGIDYLYCNRYEQKTMWVSKRWQIAIILKNKKVGDIQVTMGLLGP